MSLLPFPVSPTHADVVMQDVTDGAYGVTFMQVFPAVLLSSDNVSLQLGLYCLVSDVFAFTQYVWECACYIIS